VTYVDGRATGSDYPVQSERLLRKMSATLQPVITRGRMCERDVRCRLRYRLRLPGPERVKRGVGRATVCDYLGQRERREVSAKLQAVITRAVKETGGFGSAKVGE